MSETTGLATIKIEVTSQDVVTIAVADAEAALRQQRNILELELKEAKAVEAADTKAYNKAVEEAWDERIKDAKALFEDGFKKLGFEGRFTSNHHTCQKEKTISGNITISPNKTGYNNTFSFDMKTPRHILTLDKSEKNKEIVHDLNEKLAEIRRQLKELPTIERQARAALAKGELNKTAEGKRLLATLSLKNLPQLS